MEFPVAAASSFNGLASGPDGNIWFSEKANRVGRVAVNGTPAADIMLGNEPETLFVASDRTVWLIESSAGRIVHLSSSGMVLSDFPLGGNIHPQSITVGQDGNVWFTDASSVGRITAAGSPTEYSTPSASALMLDIAAGPAGSLWFTEYNANKIGRIDPAAANPGSTILEYSLPHAASGPEQLVLGADGAIWFTEYDGQRVGRIATGGTITEIDVPTAAGAGPAGITVGPGGDLWITDFADDIVRINSSGVTMTYQVTATGSGTDDIVLGPDGNIWFTEFNTGKLGRFVP